MIKGAFLLVGSNLGNRLVNLQTALELLSLDVGSVLTTSEIYQTAAWGNTNQGDFLNQIIKIQTSLQPAEVLLTIKHIETRMGRQETGKWGARIIDIDILYLDSRVIHDANLTVPHPEISNRRFTLVPLCEIAPNFVHPLLKKTNSQLLDHCKDPLKVELFETNPH